MIYNLTREKIFNFKKTELVTYLDDLDLDITGTKVQLVERLYKYVKKKHELYHGKKRTNTVTWNDSHKIIDSKISLLQVTIDDVEFGIDLKTHRLFKFDDKKWALLDDAVWSFDESRILKLVKESNCR